MRLAKEHYKSAWMLIVLLLCCLASVPAAGQDANAPANYSIDLGYGATMEMIWIPGGSFMMGTPSGEAMVQLGEKPQTEVGVDGFWIGRCEVTQAQYEAIMGHNPSQFKGSDNPVDSVTWHKSMEFCARLSDLTGHYYTLPTEAQWEYACRAGGNSRFYWGNDPDSLDDYAWHGGNSDKATHAVGQKQPNAWGLYDMSGNVEEWCLTLYKIYPYSETDSRNGLEDTIGARVLRGGSWYEGDPRFFRSAHRSFNPAGHHNTYSGFRCVRIP